MDVSCTSSLRRAKYPTRPISKEASRQDEETRIKPNDNEKFLQYQLVNRNVTRKTYRRLNVSHVARQYMLKPEIVL